MFLLSPLALAEVSVQINQKFRSFNLSITSAHAFVVTSPRSLFKATKNGNDHHEVWIKTLIIQEISA